MDKHFKLLLVGAVLAGVVAGGTALNTYRLESKLLELESMCSDEGRRNPKSDGFDFRPTCDGKALVELDTSSDPLLGIQAEIAATQRALVRSAGWPYTVAVLIIVLLGMPWAWYFLLKRNRELRDAILGKDA